MAICDFWRLSDVEAEGHYYKGASLHVTPIKMRHNG